MDTPQHDSDTTDQNEPQHSVIPRTRTRMKRAFWWSFLLGSMSTAIYLIATNSNRMIDVNQEVLQAARARWEAGQYANYLVEIEVTTSGTDTYQVTVKNNQAVQVLLNGNALHRRHAFDTWTVAGMLDTIALDIEHCERWEQGRAAPGTCDLMINGTFDETTGIPRKYIRMELGRPNSIGVMDWKITRFTPTDKAVLSN